MSLVCSANAYASASSCPPSLCSAARPPLRKEARRLCVPASWRVCLFAERSRAHAHLKVLMLTSRPINTFRATPKPLHTAKT